MVSGHTRHGRPDVRRERHQGREHRADVGEDALHLKEATQAALLALVRVLARIAAEASLSSPSPLSCVDIARGEDR